MDVPTDVLPRRWAGPFGHDLDVFPLPGPNTFVALRAPVKLHALKRCADAHRNVPDPRSIEPSLVFAECAGPTQGPPIRKEAHPRPARRATGCLCRQGHRVSAERRCASLGSTSLSTSAQSMGHLSTRQVYERNLLRREAPGDGGVPTTLPGNWPSPVVVPPAGPRSSFLLRDPARRSSCGTPLVVPPAGPRSSLSSRRGRAQGMVARTWTGLSPQPAAIAAWWRCRPSAQRVSRQDDCGTAVGA